MKCPFAASKQPSPLSSVSGSAAVSESVNEAVNGVVLAELSRRGVLQAIALGVGALALPSLAGCAADEANEGESGAGAVQTGGSFYGDIAAAIQATPITVAPPGPTSTPEDIAKFKEEAGKRGKAIAGVISAWLQKAYSTTDASGQKVRGLFEELFDNRAQKPLFNPGIGPAVVFQHAHVLELLLNTAAFTVDPYAPVMQTATSGNFFPPPATGVPGGHAGDTSKGFYNHYMLGTDVDALYIPDAIISRRVVRQNDRTRLRKMIRAISEGLGSTIRKGVPFDAVALCRYVPVRVVGQYLGVPSFPNVGDKGVDGFNIEDLKAGDSFAPDASFVKRFSLQKVTQGVVPTELDLYSWIRDAFRNTFNNLQRDPAFADAGLRATELLLLWMAKLIAFYRAKLETNQYSIDGTTVPDTMLVRLLVLQKDARDPSKQQALIKELACSGVDELLARTADDRVLANLFGAVVGAVANPEEANARILQSLLRFKEGTLRARDGKSSYAKLRGAAREANSGEERMSVLNAYALEFLRVNPQGETLLRKCVKDTTIGGVLIKAGTLVFGCHAAAMRDAEKIAEPETIDSTRSPDPRLYSFGKDERSKEDKQSAIYLQHGFGRHKCLGRYASEITMQEVLRAVLRVGDIERVNGGDLKMDANNLYADSFTIKLV